MTDDLQGKTVELCKWPLIVLTLDLHVKWINNLQGNWVTGKRWRGYIHIYINDSLIIYNIISFLNKFNPTTRWNCGRESRESLSNGTRNSWLSVEVGFLASAESRESPHRESSRVRHRKNGNKKRKPGRKRKKERTREKCCCCYCCCCCCCWSKLS